MCSMSRKKESLAVEEVHIQVSKSVSKYLSK